VIIPAMKRYSEAKRLMYGLLWAFWTVTLTVGGLAALASGVTALGGTDTASLGTTPLSSPGSIWYGLIGLGLAGLAGWYDYRIWTWQAKRLWFFIIF